MYGQREGREGKRGGGGGGGGGVGGGWGGVWESMVGGGVSKGEWEEGGVEGENQRGRILSYSEIEEREKRERGGERERERVNR